MDRGLKHGNMFPVLKTEEKKCPSPEQVISSIHWEHEDSDPESFVQERTYQQQLLMCVNQHDKNKYTPLQQDNGDSLQQGNGEHDYTNDDEDLQVLDSLEATLSFPTKGKPTTHAEFFDTKIDESRGSWPLSDDAYSDLRYYPNWRNQLKENSCFRENPDIAVEEYYQVHEENSIQSNRQGRDIRGGCRYIIDTSPAVMLTPYMTAIEPDQPYCQHPQSSTSSSVTSTSCHNHALQCRSPGTNATELQTQHQQQPTCTQGALIQSTNATSLTSPEVLLDKKPERQMEDIVESNKLTLGRNRSKCGSYARAHSLKQEMPYNINEHPHTQAVRPEKGNCWRSTLARLATATKLKSQRTTTSQPFPPTIQLFNTSPHLLSLLQQRSLEAIIKLASLHGRPDGRPSSGVKLSLYPRYQQTGKLSHASLQGQNVQLHHLEKRTTAAQWLLTCERPEDQTWNLNQVPQYLPWTPTTASSQGLGSCTVLPPIRKSMTGKQLKMNPSQTVHTVSPIHGSSFDSYLVQMEKQKQRRTRVTITASKHMKSDQYLQARRSDYPVVENPKMKRQKLYSNVIREQNKKISRIPFLPAKDPEGSDKKVPRMKALEYAKTIAKPPVKSQPKQRQKQPEGFTEHASHFQQLDVPQVTRLEVLRKRHEEEKHTVSLFRMVHAV